MPEVVTHGVDGYLVAPHDVAAAGKYAIEILGRADRGREMGQLARVNARKKFCANDIIPQYEEYYKQVLAASSAAARA
jgi:glycosyltransferase involved in cell wall biosynthesis